VYVSDVEVKIEHVSNDLEFSFINSHATAAYKVNPGMSHNKTNTIIDPFQRSPIFPLQLRVVFSQKE